MTATMRSRSAATVVELMDADPRVSVVLAEISVERFEEARAGIPTAPSTWGSWSRR